MPASAAKKPSKSTPPQWSKVGGDSKRAGAGKSARDSRPTPIRSKAGSSKRPSPRRSQAPAFEIPAHLRREVTALFLLVVGLLFAVGLFTWSRSGGGIMAVAGGVLAQLFGVAAWLVPIALVIASVILLFGSKAGSRWTSPVVPLGLMLMLLGAMGLMHLFANGQPAAEAGQGGGYVGLALSTFLSDYLTKVGAGVVLLAAAVLGFMLSFGVSLAELVRGVGGPTVAVGKLAGGVFEEAAVQISSFMHERAERQRRREPLRINGEPVESETALHDTAALTAVDLTGSAQPPTVVNLLGAEVSKAEAEARQRAGAVINPMKAKNGKGSAGNGVLEFSQSPLGYLWSMPPMNLLETSSEAKISQSDIKNKIKIIEETLQTFKVDAVVREVNTGPAVTQFAVEPGVGMRLNKITQLNKEITLALATSDIRIEAPIPGQSRVGIEVPNATLQVVGLRNIMESEPFTESKFKLKIALGRDTHGHPVVTDMTKLPHLLVAGATGSGKSVFLNSMIIGFLLQFTPDDLRMLMVDPKRVELTPFNGIPHLLRPVVTDVRLDKDPQMKPKGNGGASSERDRPLTAVEALKWALWEMERRYKLFEKGVKGPSGMRDVFRNIAAYRAFQRENPEIHMEQLPYIVIIIDELADLMLTAPEEVETSLCRLAQLARATGIHLVVATQRPSVDVVTGLIKANFPARVAFAVTSYRDSQVILDSMGAEKLLGKGDMLYTASDESKPIRIQGTFVSDAEQRKVVDYWRKQLPSLDETDPTGLDAQITTPPLQPMPMPDWLGTGNADEDSEMLEQAIDLVKRNRYVSVSMLQRKLRVGYNRAARLVEQMEEMGLISAASGDNRGRPREVLLGAPDDRLLDAERGMDDDSGHEV